MGYEAASSGDALAMPLNREGYYHKEYLNFTGTIFTYTHSGGSNTQIMARSSNRSKQSIILNINQRMTKSIFDIFSQGNK
jgi:hypothetical protein